MSLKTYYLYSRSTRLGENPNFYLSAEEGFATAGKRKRCIDFSVLRTIIEPLRMGTPRDRPKSPSYRNFGLIEVSQNFHMIVCLTLKYQFMPFKMSRLTVYVCLSAFVR